MNKYVNKLSKYLESCCNWALTKFKRNYFTLRIWTVEEAEDVWCIGAAGCWGCGSCVGCWGCSRGAAFGVSTRPANRRSLPAKSTAAVRTILYCFVTPLSSLIFRSTTNNRKRAPLSTPEGNSRAPIKWPLSPPPPLFWCEMFDFNL